MDPPWGRCRHLPQPGAIIRLVGAIPAEWTEQRRYVGTEILTETRMTVIDGMEGPPPRTRQITGIVDEDHPHRGKAGPTSVCRPRVLSKVA